MPPKAGAVELMPAEMLAELQALTIDGMLPPWSDWFGPGMMQELVPDDAKRAVISAELATLPLAYFEEPVPSRTGGPAYRAVTCYSATRTRPKQRETAGQLYGSWVCIWTSLPARKSWPARLNR